MKLGYFYHETFIKKSVFIHCKKHNGDFIRALAERCDEFYLFGFTEFKELGEGDCLLQIENLVFIDLGNKRKFPFNVTLGFIVLWKFRKYGEALDMILVRAPSPLAPWFYFLFKRTEIAYLMVGDYTEAQKHQQFIGIRRVLNKIFNSVYESLQNRAIELSTCIVNSVPLKEKYLLLNPSTQIVKTTTLNPKDFCVKVDSFLSGSIIKILYVGRIERAKGVSELLACHHMLISQGYNVELHLVGELIDLNLLNEDEGIIQSKNSVYYHGYKSSYELLKFYRESQIFVIASYNEGFPRVVWEAMANSLPVVATSVGSIPYFLENRKDCLLVPPKSAEDIYKSIIILIENEDLRIELIKEGLKKVRNHTVDVQVDKIYKILFN